MNTIIVQPDSSIEYKVKQDGNLFKILSDSLYTDKIEAVIRELCTNAQDSHIDANQTKPFDVTIPSTDFPYFVVKDYGLGLDNEEIENVYSTYNSSTKRASEKTTGSLGLGSKSPFAYTEYFLISAIKNGIKRVYLSSFKKGSDYPILTLQAEEKTTEPNGVEIKVPVVTSEVAIWKTKVIKILSQFKTPANIRWDLLELFPSKDTVLYSDLDLGTKLVQNQSLQGEDTGTVFVRQNSVLYRLETNMLYLYSVTNGYLKRIIETVANTANVIIEVPDNTYTFTISREKLESNQDFRLVRETLVNWINSLLEKDADIIRKLPSLYDQSAYIKAYKSFPITSYHYYSMNDWYKSLLEGYVKEYIPGDIKASWPLPDTKENLTLLYAGRKTTTIPSGAKIVLIEQDDRCVRLDYLTKISRANSSGFTNTYILTIKFPKKTEEAHKKRLYNKLVSHLGDPSDTYLTRHKYSDFCKLKGPEEIISSLVAARPSPSAISYKIRSQVYPYKIIKQSTPSIKELKNKYLWCEMDRSNLTEYDGKYHSIASVQSLVGFVEHVPNKNNDPREVIYVTKKVASQLNPKHNVLKVLHKFAKTIDYGKIVDHREKKRIVTEAYNGLLNYHNILQYLNKNDNYVASFNLDVVATENDTPTVNYTYLLRFFGLEVEESNIHFNKIAYEMAAHLNEKYPLLKTLQKYSMLTLNTEEVDGIVDYMQLKDRTR